MFKSKDIEPIEMKMFRLRLVCHSKGTLSLALALRLCKMKEKELSECTEKSHIDPTARVEANATRWQR